MGMFSFVGDILGDITGANDAAKESRNAADENLAFQKEGLDYLKETQALPLEYRDKSLTGLYDYYDPTNPQGQQQFIDRAKASPFYQSSLEEGMRGVLGAASATGGLRGGNINPEIFDVGQRTLQNTVNQQLMGLGGFAQTPINGGQVAQQYSNMGNTAAMGRIGAEQTKQAGIGQGLGGLLGLAGLGVKAGWI